jgi:hypothetical protein
LCFFEIGTPLHWTFGARIETLRAATQARLAGAAGVEHLVVWCETAAARDILDGFVQSVDPLPCRRGALLMRNALYVAKVSRTI